ncbi:MAG TPA: carboxymuconolactone decarboxylase family protein [Acidimicrobiales bacterium]|nr:carboxymuconolactone decarboxylase family protein [Acidimicrobiales bacterium]
MDVRIPPAPPEGLGPLARVVAKIVGGATHGEPPRVFTTLGRHRGLFRTWLPFAGTLLLRTCLPRADVELVVLRTACNCSAPYEWVQHVPLARKAGLRAEVIAAVPAWQQHEALSSRQRLLLAATDELHAHRIVSQTTWDQLTCVLDELQVIELCMLVGHYEMVAMTLNSLGVQSEPRAEAGLDASARQTADGLTATRDAFAAEPGDHLPSEAPATRPSP